MRQLCCAECDSVSPCTVHSKHTAPGHDATPLHNKQQHNFTACFNIIITLASLKCKLPDDGCRPKYVGAISF